MFFESKRRALVKAITWRVSGTLATAVIVYIFTSKIDLALLIGGIETISKTALYFLHERFWNHISFGKKRPPSGVIWLTGLSGSGKTTIADLVHQRFTQRGFKVERLDGDTIRKIFPSTGFSREERELHIQRVGHLASRLEAHGVIVIASLISPYAESRSFVKSLCQNYFEVYLSTSLAVCESRDPKGLYRKARQGLIQSFTGIDDPYDVPAAPDLTVDTGQVSAEEATRLICQNFISHQGK